MKTVEDMVNKGEGRNPLIWGTPVMAQCTVVTELVIATNIPVGLGFQNDKSAYHDLPQLKYEKAKPKELYNC